MNPWSTQNKGVSPSVTAFNLLYNSENRAIEETQDISGSELSILSKVLNIKEY